MEWLKELIVIISFVIFSNAKDFDCSKAKLNINYIRNCHDGEHIITILKNSTIEMNDKCELYSYMCSYLEPYHHATFEVSISKDDQKHFEDKVDLCFKPKRAHSLSKVAMVAFGVPFVCPVAFNYTSCGNGKMIFSGSDESMTVLKGLWNDGGKTKIYADIIHDTGKSCMEAEIQLTMD